MRAADTEVTCSNYHESAGTGPDGNLPDPAGGARDPTAEPVTAESVTAAG